MTQLFPGSLEQIERHNLPKRKTHKKQKRPFGRFCLHHSAHLNRAPGENHFLPLTCFIKRRLALTWRSVNTFFLPS